MAIPQGPNQRWSLDFVSDALADGRRFRILCVIDDFSRKCLATVVDTSLSGHRVVRELDRIAEMRGFRGPTTDPRARGPAPRADPFRERRPSWRDQWRACLGGDGALAADYGVAHRRRHRRTAGQLPRVGRSLRRRPDLVVGMQDWLILAGHYAPTVSGFEPAPHVETGPVA